MEIVRKKNLTKRAANRRAKKEARRQNRKGEGNYKKSAKMKDPRGQSKPR